MITDKDLFTGIIFINDKTLKDGNVNTTALLEQIEAQILTDLLGYKLKKALEAALETQKYKDLIDGVEYTPYNDLLKVAGLTVMLPYLQYFYLSRDLESFNTSIGTFEGEAENSSRQKEELRRKATTAYNIGLGYYYELIYYISYKNNTKGSDYYEGFLFKSKTRINILGL